MAAVGHLTFDLGATDGDTYALCFFTVRDGFFCIQDCC